MKGFVPKRTVAYRMPGRAGPFGKRRRQGIGVAALAGAGRENQHAFFHWSSSSVSGRSRRAGTPATTVLGATSLVTTAPAATMAPSPMVTPREHRGVGADPDPITDDDVSWVEPGAPGGRGVVIQGGQHHVMSDEDAVADVMPPWSWNRRRR